MKAYKGVYCGLCRRIATYSQTARLMLSFDMVFLAMLSEYDQNERYLALGRRKCLKKYKDASDPLDYWACVSVMMIYQKIRNDVNDGDVRKKIVLKGLEVGYSRAGERYPETERYIREALEAIEKLEKAQCDDPCRIAKVFADMLVQVYKACPGTAPETDEHQHMCRVVEQLALWVYCIDFYDDALKDEKDGQYNPLIVRAGKENRTLSEVRKEFRDTIDRYVEELQRLCDYLPYGGFQHVIKNVLHEGIVAVTARIVVGDKK
ncbi:MAG: hypothetical protein IKJ51_11425 [Clostridia bacterium]|nr:hypothetical protein [Clostridia bacterium]